MINTPERPLDPPEETIRPEPEFERDTSLVDALKEITLSQQIDRLDDLCERLENTTYGKRQG